MNYSAVQVLCLLIASVYNHRLDLCVPVGIVFDGFLSFIGQRSRLGKIPEIPKKSH